MPPFTPRYISFDELMVGQNDVTYADTLNRALQDVILQSNGTITNFVGFSLVGHTHAVSDITNLNAAISGPQIQLANSAFVNLPANITWVVIPTTGTGTSRAIQLPPTATGGVIRIIDVTGYVNQTNQLNISCAGSTPDVFVGQVQNGNNSFQVINPFVDLTFYPDPNNAVWRVVRNNPIAASVTRPSNTPYNCSFNYTDQFIWMTAANLVVNLPAVSSIPASAGVITIIDPLGDLAPFTLTVNTSSPDVMAGPGIVSNSTTFTLSNSAFSTIQCIPIEGVGWLILGIGTQGFPQTVNDVNATIGQYVTKVVVNNLTAARQLTLPTLANAPYSSAGAVQIDVWDASGAAAAHNVTAVTAEGASTKINGVAGNTPQTVLSSNYQRRSFYGNMANSGSSATNWIMV